MNYHLSALERDGWIRRTRRHRRSSAGLELHSTLYVLLPRAFSALRRMLRGAVQWTRAAKRRRPTDTARQAFDPLPIGTPKPVPKASR